MVRPVVSTSRITLAHPRPDDEEEFLARVAESVAMHRPWAFPPRTPTAFTDYLRRARRRDQASFFVRTSDEGRLAGAVNVSYMVRGNLCSAYVGYYLFTEFEGRGLMREALTLVMDHAFGPLGLHRLEANVQPGNTRSLALVERCGFRREGFSPRYLNIDGAWRDHERWAITVEDLTAGR